MVLAGDDDEGYAQLIFGAYESADLQVRKADSLPQTGAAASELSDKQRLRLAEKQEKRERKALVKAQQQAEAEAARAARRLEKEAKESEKLAKRVAREAERAAKEAEKEAERAAKEAEKQTAKGAKQVERAAGKAEKQTAKKAESAAEQEARRKGAGDHAPRLPQHSELAEDLRDDEEAVAVWNAAMTVSRQVPEIEVMGWRLYAIERKTEGEKTFDTYYQEPDGRRHRSRSVLHKVLERRVASRRSGAPIWQPPALGSMVQVYIQDETMAEHEFEWRAAKVLRTDKSGIFFQVVVFTRNGEPDPEFLEWYSDAEEGNEWRPTAALGHSAGSSRGERDAQGHEDMTKI